MNEFLKKLENGEFYERKSAERIRDCILEAETIACRHYVEKSGYEIVNGTRIRKKNDSNRKKFVMVTINPRDGECIRKLVKIVEKILKKKWVIYGLGS